MCLNTDGHNNYEAIGGIFRQEKSKAGKILHKYVLECFRGLFEREMFCKPAEGIATSKTNLRAVVIKCPA